MKTELRIIVMLLFCAALSGCASQRGMQLHPATDVCTVIVHSAGRLKREAGSFKGRVCPCME